MALQSLFPTAKPTTAPTGFNVPQGWSSVDNNSNDVYRNYLGYGRKMDTAPTTGAGFAGQGVNVYGDLEQNKLYNQQQDEGFAAKFPGQQMIRRQLDDGLYEYGLLGQDGNISNNWQHQFSTDNWMDKYIPGITMASLAAMAGQGLFGAESAAGGGGLSGMDLAADAALGTGNNIVTAGAGLGGAGAAGAVGGSGLTIPQAGAATGSGLNLSGAAPGAVFGSGEGLAIAPGAVGAASGGTGLGAMIGSTIPGGDILAGLGGIAGGASGGLPGAATQVGKTVGGNIAQDLIGKVLGGGAGGISNLGNLASLFTNYNQYNKMGDLINEIKSIYKPDGEYAKYMENQLGRRDAAAGRNSQYGPRLSELMGRLGDSQARALSGLGGMMATQQGGLNGMVGAGGRLAGGMGLGDLLSGLLGGGGGMSVGELGTNPSTWDRPAEDIDWESLWGG